MYVCMYVCTVCMCMYVCMYVCTYVCVYVCNVNLVEMCSVWYFRWCPSIGEFEWCTHYYFIICWSTGDLPAWRVGHYVWWFIWHIWGWGSLQAVRLLHLFESRKCYPTWVSIMNHRRFFLCLSVCTYVHVCHLRRPISAPPTLFIAGHCIWKAMLYVLHNVFLSVLAHCKCLVACSVHVNWSCVIFFETSYTLSVLL